MTPATVPATWHRIGDGVYRFSHLDLIVRRIYLRSSARSVCWEVLLNGRHIGLEPSKRAGQGAAVTRIQEAGDATDATDGRALAFARPGYAISRNGVER